MPLRTVTENAVRDRVVAFKVNDDEWKFLHDLTAEKGFRSVSDLLRAALNQFAGLTSSNE